MEQSLVLIKPDAVERQLIGEILNKYERNHLRIKQMKMLTVSKELADEHYAELRDKPFFNKLMAYITRSPVVAVMIEGDDAIAKVRQINGATNPEEAAPNTIRALYALSVTENSVHASDSLESAKREISIWFG